MAVSRDGAHSGAPIEPWVESRCGLFWVIQWFDQAPSSALNGPYKDRRPAFMLSMLRFDGLRSKYFKLSGAMIRIHSAGREEEA